MNREEQKKVINNFIKYLESRDLSICNFTKVGMTFWPIDTEGLAERSLNR